jgi:hypothetical protein
MRQEVYCRSIDSDEDTGDYFFVMWKKTGDGSDKLRGILENAGAGEVKGDSISIKAKKVAGQKVIHGDPMYYWFIPEFNLLASIKFPYSLTESELVSSFIKRCVDNKVPHPCKKTVTASRHYKALGRDILVNNTTYESTDGKHKSLRFYFNVNEKRINIYDTDLAKLAKSITHVVVRDVISTKHLTDERGTVLQLYNKVMRRDKKPLYERHVEVETEVSFTENELKDLVDLYQQEYDPLTNWINIGFKEGKEEPAKFFNSYLERTTIMADPINKHDNTHYTSSHLKSIILRERDSLLASFYVAKNKDTGTD